MLVYSKCNSKKSAIIFLLQWVKFDFMALKKEDFFSDLRRSQRKHLK